MRKLFDNQKSTLSSFVEQRDDLLLLTAATAGEGAIVLRLLRDLDRAASNDIYLLFAADFSNAESFVNAVLAQFENEHRGAMESRTEKGEPALAPFPSELLTSSSSAGDRLKAAITFAKTLLPADSGHRLAWAMFPLEVKDWNAYYEFVRALACHGTVEPWMRGVRLICRVQEDFALPGSSLAGAQRVRVCRANFGPEAVDNALQEAAADEKAPLAQRMDALLSLAMIDVGYQRLPQANARLDLLLDYHRETNNHPMQALTLNGLGDSAKRGNDLKQARAWYETALPPAAAAEQPVILAMLVQNLAETTFQMRDYVAAEQYYDQLAILKDSELNEEGKALALEGRGLSQEKQEKWDAAVQSLEEALLLSRAFELKVREKEVLQHLERNYQRAKRDEDLKFVHSELQALTA